MAQLDKFKLSALTWESDKDPKGFYLWVENMSSLVRSTEHGAPLEDMLDSKLGRPKVSVANVPSFLLEDPDFAPPAIAAAVPENADDEVVVQIGNDNGSQSNNPAQNGHFTLGAHSVRYTDLTDQTKTLDAMLYNVLRMNVKGSKGSLLSCVTFPSYVQAICVLEKHMSISRMDRIMRCLDA